MITFQVKIHPKDWRAVRRWSKVYRRNMNDAMRQALAVLHGQIFVNLSGPSHTLFPGNGNPFPGTVTGRMKNSLSAQVYNRPREVRGVVGPNVHYAIKHITGDGVKKRDYLTPAFKKRRREVNRILRRAVRESLQ